MSGKNILVAGASGAVGEGIVAELLQLGHSVTIVLRKASQFTALKDYLDTEGVEINNLNGVVNRFENDKEIHTLQAELSKKKIDAAIVSLGGWYHGKRLHELPLSDMQQVIEGGLFSHLRFAKSVLPVLEQQGYGHYFMINGGASEHVVPHSGIISIVAAAQKMMTKVLFQEFRESPIHICAVAAFDVVKTRQRANRDDLWLSPREITHYILELLATGSNQKFWHKISQPKDLEI